MKRRAGLLGTAILGIVAAAYFGWQWYCWDTVCTAQSPDGSHRAVVRCHWLPAGIDGRSHYYLTFDPPVTFRPVSGDTTLKKSASAVKDDRVVYDWATTHYMGYLQGFDDTTARAPVSVEWVGDLVVVRSRGGVAGQYEFQR